MENFYPAKLVSANSVNATSVRASKARLGYIVFTNTGATAYLKFYNTASTPDETMTPVQVFVLPSGAYNQGISFPADGVVFGSGMAFRITTGIADNDTGAVAASAVVLNYGVG